MATIYNRDGHRKCDCYEQAVCKSTAGSHPSVGCRLARLCYDILCAWSRNRSQSEQTPAVPIAQSQPPPYKSLDTSNFTMQLKSSLQQPLLHRQPLARTTTAMLLEQMREVWASACSAAANVKLSFDSLPVASEPVGMVQSDVHASILASKTAIVFFLCMLPFLLALLFSFAPKIYRIGRRPKDYPPGPPTRWLLGNLLQIPKSRPHLQFQKWAKEYGYAMLRPEQVTTILTNSDPSSRLFWALESLWSCHRMWLSRCFWTSATRSTLHAQSRTSETSRLVGLCSASW